MFDGNTRMGSKYSPLLVVIIANFVTVFGASCSDPQVQVQSLFTTQDATILTNIAYIAEFGVQCQSGAVSNLYADIGANNLVPVSVIGPNSYQVGTQVVVWRLCSRRSCNCLGGCDWQRREEEQPAQPNDKGAVNFTTCTSNLNAS